MEFSSLNFLLHTEALLSTITYLNSILPSEPAAARNPEARKQAEKVPQGRSGQSRRPGSACCCFLFGLILTPLWVCLCVSVRACVCAQCLKQPGTGAWSTCSCLRCWDLSTLRCVMAAAASLISGSKVGHMVRPTPGLAGDSPADPVSLQELTRPCWCRPSRWRCLLGSGTSWSQTSTPPPSTGRLVRENQVRQLQVGLE